LRESVFLLITKASMNK